MKKEKTQFIPIKAKPAGPLKPENTGVKYAHSFETKQSTGIWTISAVKSSENRIRPEGSIALSTSISASSEIEIDIMAYAESSCIFFGKDGKRRISKLSEGFISNRCKGIDEIVFYGGPAFEIMKELNQNSMENETVKKFRSYVLGKIVGPSIEKIADRERLIKEAVESMKGKLQFETEKKQAREFFDNAEYNIK